MTVQMIKGVRLSAAASGARYTGRDDMALIELCEGAETACVFTRNKFCAAPVTVARQHLERSAPRYLVINAGNANAGTGEAGEAVARAVCEAIASQAGCDTSAVLPFSTGVIGELPDAETLNRCAPALVNGLETDGWAAASRAILTTDTCAKLRSVRVENDTAAYAVTGITKGSGMIRPDMATMLAYVATDAAVESGVLEGLLQDVVQSTFNCITVDGDTSTNDALVLVATAGADGERITSSDDARYALLRQGVEEVCRELAKDIVRDGEGATKFVTIEVHGGRSSDDCRQVGFTVAESPLVKTALFASDPNWGRILAAIGRCGLDEFEIDDVGIAIGDCVIVKDGRPAPDYSEAAVQAVMSRGEIDIRIDIGGGKASATVWTCDFSYDYVRINAEYRS